MSVNETFSANKLYKVLSLKKVLTGKGYIMTEKYLLALDVGTSGCKVTLFDFQGRVQGDYLGEYKTYYPADNYVEQNPDDWWQVICQGIHNIEDKTGIKTNEIAAIGLDGTSWACIPVDREGKPLRSAMLWLDRRAEKQAKWMKNTVGVEKLINTNGNPVDPAYITPKILWIKENEPDIYKRCDKFLQSNAYIVAKLTGEYSQDYSQGYGLHFFDIRKGNWDKDIASELDISLDLMAPIYHCHDIVGTVTDKAASETGLIAGIPVVAGGLDAACCTLGAGVIEPGQTQEQGGQAGGMSIQLDEPLVHPKLILGYHAIPDQWLLQGGSVGGGGTLRWFKDELGSYEVQLAKQEEISPYQIMDQEVKKIKAGSGGLIFLPYMAGERSPIWNTRARGVLFGLSYNKERSHIIRSIMEGVGYSLLHNLKTAEEVDAYVSELRSVGGAANSQIWTQIKADITGKKILVPYSDHATTLGAAILAGVGAGVYKNFKEAVDKTVNVQRSHNPDKDNYDLYQDYYNLYLKLYSQLKESFDKLHAIGKR